MPDQKGAGLMEVLFATAIMGITITGTGMAYVAAANMRKSQESPAIGEAAACGQELLEQLRNRVSADDAWFSTKTGAGLQADMAACSSAAFSRQYQVEAADCDGVGGVGDCHRVTVKVAWNP